MITLFINSPSDIDKWSSVVCVNRSGLRTIPCAPEEEARVEASDLLPDEGASAPLDPDPSRLIGSLRMTLVIAEERKREGASRVSEE